MFDVIGTPPDHGLVDRFFEIYEVIRRFSGGFGNVASGDEINPLMYSSMF